MRRATMKLYKVDGYSSWYIVKAYNKKDARKDATHEYGRGHVKSVEVATAEDVEYFKGQKGEPDEAGE